MQSNVTFTDIPMSQINKKSLNLKNHWDMVFKTKKPVEMSWYQPHLQKSLELIRRAGISREAEIIDIGGGASTLVDDLLKAGFKRLSVLDLSAQALTQVKTRLGLKANQVMWVEANVTEVILPEHHYDLWHDRAAFHFLTSPEGRKKYVKIMDKALSPRGVVIIAAFSQKGPERCSGLDVARHSPESVQAELGKRYHLLETAEESHETPFGTRQEFVYCVFKREE